MSRVDIMQPCVLSDGMLRRLGLLSNESRGVRLRRQCVHVVPHRPGMHRRGLFGVRSVVHRGLLRRLACTTVSTAHCGGIGGLCVTCDPALADSCVTGLCNCGTGAQCVPPRSYVSGARVCP